MSVIHAEILESSDGGWQRDGSRTYTEVWAVTTDDPNDHASTVLVSPLIPQVFDVYQPGNSFDTGAYVQGRIARRVENKRTRWLVTITYSTAGESNNCRDENGQVADNPLDEPWVVQYRSGQGEQSLDKDFSDPPKALVNAAEDAFDPPYMVPKRFRILTITRNEASYDDSVISEYIDTTNDEAFRGKPARCWYMADIQADEMRKAALVYHRVTYELHYHKAVWNPTTLNDTPGCDLLALNQGFNYLNGGNKLAAMDDGNPPQRVNAPILLAVNGGKLALGAAANYLEFIRFKPVSWAALNLDP